MEMIVVMGIMGIIFTSFALYKKRQIESVARENLANVIVGEMYGFLQFTHEDEIELNSDDNADGERDVILNPLYDKSIQPTDDKGKAYSWRSDNTALNAEPGNENHYIKWDNDQMRGYFTSHRCFSSSNQKVADKEFTTDYLRCNQPLNSQDKFLVLERIDLIGNGVEGDRTIQRIDFFVSFHPGKEGSKDIDKFSLENYATAFSQALSHYNIAYTQADYLYRSSALKSDAINFGVGWKLLKAKSASSTDDAIPFGSLASWLDKIDQNAEQLGIRFSFIPGMGEMVKPDGSIGVDKLCWNYDENKLTHCLEVEKGTGRNSEQGVMHLTAKNNENETVTGTLMANVIFEGEAYNPESGQNEIALMTSPVISYQSFGNTKGGTDVIIDDPENYDKNVTDEPGYIKLPVQTCPVAPNVNDPAKPIQLYPRLAAALSSIVADVGKSENSDGTIEDDGNFSDFSNSEMNRVSANGVLDHLSGVAIQVNFIDETEPASDYWVVSATSGVYDNVSGKGVNVINPGSLSVVLTSWCSSVKQPAHGKSVPMPPTK